jgi:methyl-accepting chemotaxis protein
MFQIVAKAMRRMRYPSRFAIIGAVFAIALIYLTYGLYRSNQDNADFSSKELIGTQYLKPTMVLLAQIQQQRVLAEKGRHAQPIWSRPGQRCMPCKPTLALN